MAIQTVFLAENTTAYATDVMNLVDPLYTDLDGSNVSDKTGTGTTLVLSANPTFTGTVTVASMATSGNLTVGGTILGGPFTGNLAVTGNLSATGTFAVNGNMTFGDASGDTIAINAATASIPNGLNIGSDLFYLNNTNSQVFLGGTTQSDIDSLGNYRLVVKALGSNRAGILVEGNNDGVSGMVMAMYQNSSTPAASDQIGSLIYKGNNSSGLLNPVDYFKIRGHIRTATAGAEDGGFDFRAIKAGVEDSVMSYSAATSTINFNNNSFDNVNNISLSSTSAFQINSSTSSTTFSNGLLLGNLFPCGIGATNVNYVSGVNNRTDLTLVAVNNGNNEQITFSSRNSYFAPTTDNSLSCGKSGGRWTEVWAAIGAINTSDERAKINIEDCNLGLDFLNQLKTIKYNQKFGKNHQDFYGLSFQQVEKVLAGRSFAGLAYAEKEEDFNGLRYTELIAPMIKAIQQLNTKINDLEGRLLG